MCKVHEAIIALGFRESKTIGGTAARYGKKQSCYKRGAFEVRYTDYGVNTYFPNNPDANRYVLQLFLDGKKISGGTAWQSILKDVPFEG
jgi:hypothetical protein